MSTIPYKVLVNYYGQDDMYNTPLNLRNRASSFDNFIDYTWLVLNFNYCAGQNDDGSVNFYAKCDPFEYAPIDKDILRDMWQVYSSVAKTHGEYYGDNKQRVIDEIQRIRGYDKKLLTDFLNELEAQWRGTPQRMGSDMWLYPTKYQTKSAPALQQGKEIAQDINQTSEKLYTENRSFLQTMGDFFSGALSGLETTGKIMFWVIIVGVVVYLGYLLYNLWNIKKAVA